MNICFWRSLAELCIKAGGVEQQYQVLFVEMPVGLVAG
jgi:hypothetical protein